MNDKQWRTAGARAISTVVALMLATTFWERATLAQTTLKYSQFIQQVKSGKIERVGVSADRSRAIVHAKDGTKATVKLSPKDPKLIKLLTDKAVQIYVIYDGNRNRSRSVPKGESTQTQGTQPNPASAEKTLTYSQFIRDVKSGKIARVGFNADRSQANVHAKDGTEATVSIPANDERLIDLLTENTVEIYILPPDGEPNRLRSGSFGESNPP